MPTPIPGDLFRYIQQEEAAAKWSFSESVVQGVGKNNNYLKSEFDRIQGLIDSYFANAALSIVALSMTGTPNASMVSPSGKPWFVCFLTLISAGVRVAETHPITPGANTWYNTGAAIIQASISGNTVTVYGYAFGTANYFGYGLYET